MRVTGRKKTRTKVTPPRKPEDIQSDTQRQLVDLLRTIKGYKELVKAQQRERELLLSQLDHLTNSSIVDQTILNKIDALSQLIQSLDQKVSKIENTIQGGAVSISVSEPSDSLGEPVTEESSDSAPASHGSAPAERKALETSSEISPDDGVWLQPEERITLLTTEIEELSLRTRELQSEIKRKDELIATLNEKLELLTEERDRLKSELNRLNELVGTWTKNMEVLERLARTDPRYRVFNIVKRNKELNEIQLAFACGLSVSDLRKYVEDLKKIGLVTVSNSNVKWTGRDLDFGSPS